MPGGAQAFSIIDFGADPTGSRDSRDAILTAIVTARTHHAYVEIPPGDYMVNTGIGVDARSLYLASGDSIIGYGPASRLFKAPVIGGQLSDRPIFMQLDGNARIDNILLSNFCIDGNSAVNDNGVTALLRLGSTAGGDNIEIADITMRNVPTAMFGIYITGTTPGRLTNLNIHDCLLENLNKDGIHLMRVDGLIVVDNEIYTGTPTNVGDDQLAMQDCTNVVVDGNIIANASTLNPGSAGRNIWCESCDDVMISNNQLYEGYRAGVHISGDGTNDITIADNEITDIGKRCNLTTRCDAIDIDLNAAAATARRIQIYGNAIITPRRNAIGLLFAQANNVIEFLSIKDNYAYIDRAASWLLTTVADGHFLYIDTTVQAGTLVDQLEVRSNWSEQMVNEGIYLKGVGIRQPRVIDEKHYECGRANPDQKAAYYFESLAQFEVRGCIGRDRSGLAWTDYGARFINMNAASGGGRGRVNQCDFLDTVNGNVVWNPAGAPTVWYNGGSNFGAAALPA